MLFLDLLADEEEEAALGHGFSLGFEGTSFPITTPCRFEPFGGEAEGSSGFCFCGDLGLGLGLKHFMVELGWQTRAAREAAIRHLSTMFVFVKVTIAVHQSALKRFLKLRFKYDSQTYQLHPNAIKSWPSKLFIIPVVCRTM